MSKKFTIGYGESDKNGQETDIFYYEQKKGQKNTIRDVKEYVKEQRYKKHELVCTCQLVDWGLKTDDSLIFYNDDIYLDNILFFRDKNPMLVVRIREKCTCGQLEKLLISSSNYEKQREEDKKRWEEKERRDKEYYDRRFNEEKIYHQNEINCLRNI